jgi:hypothetical protein
MTPTYFAMIIFNILVELINGSLIPSVSKGTVLGTMVARWFGDWMY